MDEFDVDEENLPTDNVDDESKYVDCIRLVQGEHVRRFENVVAKFDIVNHELNNSLNKSLLFYAIENNNETLVKILLEMDVPLNKSYSVSNESIESYERALNRFKNKAYLTSNMSSNVLTETLWASHSFAIEHRSRNKQILNIDSI
jgi:hypothetical protein